MLSLRRGTLALVIAGAVGLAAELALTSHWHDWLQWIPFVLCGLLVAGAGASLASTSSAVRRAAQGVAVVVALGSAFGIYEHIEESYAFESEIRPNASASELVVPALTGATPALAPGALGLLAAWLLLTTVPLSERDTA